MAQDYILGTLRTDKGQFLDRGNQVYDVRHESFGHYGAKGDGLTDDWLAIQDAIDFCHTKGGGVVFLSQATYMVSATISIPENVVLRGAGSRVTVIKAMDTFPVDTEMVRMERVGSLLSFGNRIEQLLLDANSIEGSICVRIVDANQQGGLFNVVPYNYRDWGIIAEGNVGPIAGAAAFRIQTVEPTPSVLGSTGCVFFNGVGLGITIVDELSPVASTASPGDLPGTYGVRVLNSTVSMRGIGCEGHQYGIYVDTGGQVFVDGVTGGPGLDEVVHIAATASHVDIRNLQGNGSPVLIVDDLNSRTLSSAELEITDLIPHYLVGNWLNDDDNRVTSYTWDGFFFSNSPLFMNGMADPTYKPGWVGLYVSNVDGKLRTINADASISQVQAHAVNQANTTNATPTIIQGVTLADATVYHLRAYVTGVKSDGTDRASYILDATVYRTGAGSATLQGSAVQTYVSESNAAWDCIIDVTGNAARVMATGVAATTIKWRSRIELTQIGEAE